MRKAAFCTYIIGSFQNLVDNLQLLIHKQTRHPLTRPNAHTRQQYLLLLSPAFTQSRTDLPGACSSQRVPQCDCSASDVHFRRVDAEHVCTVDGHGSESLVDFDDVDVFLEVEVEFAKEFGDGEGGANTHYPRSNTGNGGATKFSENGLVHPLGGGTFHEENGGRWEKI